MINALLATTFFRLPTKIGYKSNSVKYRMGKTERDGTVLSDCIRRENRSFCTVVAMLAAGQRDNNGNGTWRNWKFSFSQSMLDIYAIAPIFDTLSSKSRFEPLVLSIGTFF